MLTEQVIAETIRDGITQGYAAAERAVPADFVERYRAVARRYEQQ